MDTLITVDFETITKIIHDVFLLYYLGNDFYTDIESVTLHNSADSLEEIINENGLTDVMYTLEIRYGRYSEQDGTENFDDMITLSGSLCDSIEFTKGKLAQLIEQKL